MSRSARPGTSERHPRGRLVAPLLAAGTTIGMGLAGIGLIVVPARPGVTAPGGSVATALLAAFVLLTPALGALLAVRRPDDRIGWLFILLTCFMVLSSLGDGAGRHVDPSPGVDAFVVIADALGSFAFATLFVVFQVFPTGRTMSGWGWLPLGAFVGTMLRAVSVLLSPASITPPIPGLVNPFAGSVPRSAVDVIEALAGLLLVVVATGTIVSLGLRFRRARGVERQQIKWFAWAGMLVVLLMATSLVAAPWQPIADVFWTLALSSLILLPVAATAAILRYRLWDIDRIVSRTIAWTVLTGLLAAAFVGLIVGLQQVLSPLTGANTLAVTGSTLAVFALFTPLRRRVQRIVDRRFDRARYDAERTVAALTARLRDETDIERGGHEIETAVRQALAPSRVAVWTRDR